MIKKLLAVVFLVTMCAVAFGHQADAPLINPTFQSVTIDSTGTVHVFLKAGTGDSLDLYFVGDSTGQNCAKLFWHAGFLKYLKCGSLDTVVIENPSAAGDDTTKFMINDDTTATLFIDTDSIIIQDEDGTHIIFKSPDVLSIQADTVGKPATLGFVTILGSMRLMIDTSTGRMFLPFDTVFSGLPGHLDLFAWDSVNLLMKLYSKDSVGGAGGGSGTFADSALHLVNAQGAAIGLTLIEDTSVYVDVTDDDTLKTWSNTNGNIWTRPGQDGNQRWIVIVDTVVDAAGNRIGNFGDGAATSGLEVVAGKLRIDAALAGAGISGGGGFTINVGSGGGLAVAADHILAAVDGTTIDTNGASTTLQVMDDGITGAKLAPAVAGAGLVQDGSGNLDVGAGTDIVVNANDVALASSVSDAADSIPVWDNGVLWRSDGSSTASATWDLSGLTGLTLAAGEIITGDLANHAVDTSKLNISNNPQVTDALLVNGAAGTMTFQPMVTAAGAGLTAAAGPIFAVGAGTDIVVNADDVALASSVSDAADSIPVWDNGVLWRSDGSATASSDWNLGALGGLEIPNAPTPTTNITGEIAFGTTNNMLEVFDGTSSLVLAGLNKPFSFPISDPDQLAKDTVMLIGIESEWAPNGVTITSIGIKTWASTSYSVTFMWYTEPGDGGTETVIKIVATSGSREAKETSGFTDAAGAVGDILVVELPTTNIDHVTVFGTFTIND